MLQDKLVVIAVGLGSIVLLVGLVYLLFVIPTPHSTINSGTDGTSTAAASLMKNTLKAVNATEPNRAEVIAKWYMPLTTLTLGDVTLQASVADTEEEREQGLSDTPYLPTGIGKLFVFEKSARWAFWMKDMQYPIDIIWLDETKTIIHIESSVAPETYPQSFVSATPATYVIEATAGFTEINHITVGAKATW